ncbi:MAG TPA: hypothetical protein VI702_02855 [Nitrospiria bacterium]
MAALFKLILLAALMLGVFGAGYFYGASKERKLSRLLKSARSETRANFGALETELRKLRLTMHLTTARDRLLTAQSSLADRNFGTAEKEIGQAREEMIAAAGMAEAETAESLRDQAKSLEALITITHRSDPRAKVKLTEARAALNRLMAGP